MDPTHPAYPVLLAEDDLVSRRLFEKILVNEGFLVTTVENGRQALELGRRQFFPIVLMDWQMPEMEGPDLCRAIRRENPDRCVFIVVLPETELSGAMAVAERLRSAVAQSATQVDDAAFPITTSIGVTGFSPQATEATITPEALLQQADQLLYQAKDAGRNRVIGRMLNA